jgi:hypothetical protein
VPHTDDGLERLADELERAHEVLEPPVLVWLFCAERLLERRGTLYAWREGAPRRALVVWHEYPLNDRVEWLCEPFVRRRHE